MEQFIGQIELFPYGFAPVGWMLCNGAILNVQQNVALFSLLGAKFGGNGTTTFGIPNLMDASPIVGTDYYIALTGIYPTRD